MHPHRLHGLLKLGSSAALGTLLAAMALILHNNAAAARLRDADNRKFASIQVIGTKRSGEPVTLSDARCLLVRYSSSNCHYCQADVPAFRALQKALLLHKCQIVVIPASPGDPTPEGGAGLASDELMPYTSIQFALATAFARTPTTLLFSDRRVWSHVGILSDHDIATAVKFVSGTGGGIVP
jgi:hypothetical protein